MQIKGKNSITFLVAQAVGCIMTVVGVVMMLVYSKAKFSLTNLGPIFKLVTGLGIAVVGLVLIAVSYRIRWMHKVIDRLDALEAYRPVLSECECGGDCNCSSEGCCCGCHEDETSREQN